MKKFILLIILIASFSYSFSQNKIENENNPIQQEVILTNIYQGNSNFINLANSSENNNPPTQQQAQQLVSAPNQNIEPSLENGFHIRFQLNAPAVKETVSKSSNSSYHSSKRKSVKKNFYRRNKIKNLLPK